MIVTIICSFIGGGVSTAIVTTLLAPLVQHFLLGKERKRIEEKHKLDVQQKKLDMQQASYTMLREALQEFPFLKMSISTYPYGGRIVTDTGNTEHPVVLIERKPYGVELSWKPEDIKGYY